MVPLRREVNCPALLSIRSSCGPGFFDQFKVDGKRKRPFALSLIPRLGPATLCLEAGIEAGLEAGDHGHPDRS